MSQKSAAGTDLPSKEKQELVARVGVAVRKMGAQSVITSRTIADRFTLHTTDLEVLDLIFLREQTSAGELADTTGLTSGSVTALIDRLVDAGYVERCADPSDRRKVLVRIRQDAVEPIKSIYMGIERKMTQLWLTYGTRDLEIIADFLSRSTELAIASCKEIQQSTPSSPPRRRPSRTRTRNISA